MRVEFDIQNAETYMTLGTYILEETKSGTHKERRQYFGRNKRKEYGRLCHGSVQQENGRQLDTIRAGVMEQSIWRQGRRVVRGTRSDDSENVGIVRNARKRAEVCVVVQNVGSRVY